MSQAKFRDVQILREGSSESGSWAIASLMSAGVACIAIRCEQPNKPVQGEEWYVLPELLARSILQVAHWQFATEDEIRRGYEEMAAYEASTDDPYPYDLPPGFEQTEGKAA